MAKSHQLRRTQFIPRPRDEVFAFFSDASNLERITPAFVGFEIPTRGPLAIQAGVRIDCWHHRHAFADVPGGTRMDDTVDYELPLGPLGEIARSLFVARSLEKIFDHRTEQIGAIFGVSTNQRA